MDAVYRMELKIPETVVDANRHVNNVAYVQWMQDAAIRHSDASGCSRLTRAAGATWVARSHQIEYLKPAFAGDVLTILTWVADFRKVRSCRRYKFVRPSDQAVIAQGETDWVFVDAGTGRPRAIPLEIRQVFEVAEPREPAQV
jgi:acyl-CoA thioester hydrolase